MRVRVGVRARVRTRVRTRVRVRVRVSTVATGRLSRVYAVKEWCEASSIELSAAKPTEACSSR